MTGEVRAMSVQIDRRVFSVDGGERVGGEMFAGQEVTADAMLG
jgi:hypothetical protein